MLLLRFVFGWLFLLITLVAQGQAGCRPAALGPRISRQAALRDLQLFQRIHETAHAGLYKYRTKAEMDSAFAAAQSHLPDSMSILDVYRLVADVTDFEGSLHNDTFLPDSVTQALNRQVTFFPFPVKFLNGALLLDYAQAALPLGTEVVAVNGTPASELAQTLGRYYTTDGFNQTGKLAGLGKYFAQYLYFEYGPFAAFQVTVRLPGGATQEVALGAVSYAVVEERYRHRHSRALDSAATPGGAHHYGFRVAGPAAILTVRSFDIGNGAKAPAHRAYRRFLDSCFAVIRATPAITGVLVDVRGNGGGTDPNDMLTFSYLASQPFRENRAAYVSCRTIPYGQYLKTDHQGLRHWREKRRFQHELRHEFAPVRSGQYPQRVRFNPLYQPSPLRSQKPVYLLVDGRVASAAAMFSALVRGNTEAVVVGEETMGGYYGHTGHTPVEYCLPNTGIVTKFSLVDLVQDVPKKASQPPGRGSLPDYPVTQSVADFVANRDSQLASALKLLTEQTAAPKR